MVLIIAIVQEWCGMAIHNRSPWGGVGGSGAEISSPDLVFYAAHLCWKSTCIFHWKPVFDWSNWAIIGASVACKYVLGSMSLRICPGQVCSRKLPSCTYWYKLVNAKFYARTEDLSARANLFFKIEDRLSPVILVVFDYGMVMIP